MDISLARTFLMVSETGSFIEAGRKLNITQSTVSARIKGLEQLLGRPLFERSKTGATLNAAGEQFRKHALALVRVWQHAQLEIGLTEQHRDLLAAGAPAGLWPGFLVRWMANMRRTLPDIAMSVTAGEAAQLTERLVEGTLDLAVLYRPVQPPGLAAEHLFDEEFVLVSSGTGSARRPAADYVSIDWGPDFLHDHAVAYPGFANPGLHLDLGPISLEYFLGQPGSAYFPARLVAQHISRGRLRQVKRARKFVYPVYMVYPEARDEEAYEPILEGLRQEALKILARHG